MYALSILYTINTLQISFNFYNYDFIFKFMNFERCLDFLLKISSSQYKFRQFHTPYKVTNTYCKYCWTCYVLIAHVALTEEKRCLDHPFFLESLYACLEVITIKISMAMILSNKMKMSFLDILSNEMDIILLVSNIFHKQIDAKRYLNSKSDRQS